MLTLVHNTYLIGHPHETMLQYSVRVKCRLELDVPQLQGPMLSGEDAHEGSQAVWHRHLL